ncbi:pyruvate-formate lyase [Actinoplanes tereljensis]
MVQSGLAAYGYSLDSTVRTIFSQYRKTHNDGVFDAYPADVLAARRSHLITGLPDAYGRRLPPGRAYLAATKEQNGAAMLLGRTSTFPWPASSTATPTAAASTSTSTCSTGPPWKTRWPTRSGTRS